MTKLPSIVYTMFSNVYGVYTMTMIRVSEKVRDKLRELGRKGDTYSDVIAKLIELHEYPNGRPEETRAS